MQVQKLNSISFKQLKFIQQQDNLKLFEDVKYQSCNIKNAETYNISAKNIGDFFCINVFKDSQKTPISNLKACIEDNNLEVLHMETNLSYRNQGLGTVLHLLNIIEMLENNAKNIKFEALSSAASFHSKLGFAANETWNNGLSQNLRMIKMCCEKFASKITRLNNSKLSVEKKEKIGNKIIDDYLKYIVQQEGIKRKPDMVNLENALIYDTNMVLTKTTVMKNKDYYNNLFKNYHIDYQIKKICSRK